MENTYKSKAERLKGDPYTGVCFQALETLGWPMLDSRQSKTIVRTKSNCRDQDLHHSGHTEQGA